MGHTAFRRAMRGLRTGDWLTIDMIVGRARVLLIINLILAAGAVVITHRPPAGVPPISVDFVSFYAAGSLARAGTPELAYDRDAHQRAEAAATEPGRGYQFFFYPPVYLFLCSALACLPYFAAFAALGVLTLGLFLWVMRHVAGPVERDAWLLPVLGFPPLLWTLGLGQNALLTASLLAGATMLVDRRPILAGLLFGALCYKPHLGLLVPVALASGGRWRAFAAAGGTVGGLVAASWLLHGTATWQAYLRVFLASGDIYGSGRISFIGMVSPFGAARLIGLTLHTALALQMVATLLAVGVVAWIWRCQESQAVRSAALLAGTMIALPVVLLYDQLITLVALAWLAREGHVSGFLPREKLVLVGVFLLPMVDFPLILEWRLPLAPLPAVMLLALCVARTRKGTGDARGRASARLGYAGG